MEIELSDETYEMASRVADAEGVTVQEFVMLATRWYVDKLIGSGQLPPVDPANAPG